MAIQAGLQTDVLIARNKLVEKSSKGYTDGICSGYLIYYDQYQGRQLTDLDVSPTLTSGQVLKRHKNRIMLTVGYVPMWGMSR